jgi:hypothetical protein
MTKSAVLFGKTQRKNIIVGNLWTHTRFRTHLGIQKSKRTIILQTLETHIAKYSHLDKHIFSHI